MADHDNGRVDAVDKLLKQIQTGAVEVIGGFVEKVGVVAREQQRGESYSGRLAARERRHHLIERQIEAIVGQHLGEAFIKIGGT